VGKRIYLSLFSSASSGYGDSMFKRIFYGTLTKMGHDVVFFSYHEASLSSKNEKLTDIEKISENIYQSFLENHKRKPFDFFLSYYHSKQVVPELFKKIREHVFCINYTTNFHQVDTYKPLLKEADLSIFASIEAKSYFQQESKQSYYMPFAGLSTNLIFDINKNNKISFIGTSYGPRAYYIWRCLQNQLPIDIYGYQWINNHKRRSLLRSIKLQFEILFTKYKSIDTAYKCLNDIILREINDNYSMLIHKPLSDEAYNKLLSTSSVVLNIPESRFGHDYYNSRVLIGANLRDFEVPTAGSLLLTQENDEIKECFDVNKEIVTYANEWEMIDKLRFYIAQPKLSLEIAKSGHIRAQKQHLWEHRFNALIKHLETNFL
jgi:hypothetical protein